MRFDLYGMLDSQAKEHPIPTVEKRSGNNRIKMVRQHNKVKKIIKNALKKLGLNLGSKYDFEINLMAEMTYAGEHHGETSFVSRSDNLFVTY